MRKDAWGYLEKMKKGKTLRDTLKDKMNVEDRLKTNVEDRFWKLKQTFNEVSPNRDAKLTDRSTSTQTSNEQRGKLILKSEKESLQSVMNKLSSEQLKGFQEQSLQFLEGLKFGKNGEKTPQEGDSSRRRFVQNSKTDLQDTVKKLQETSVDFNEGVAFGQRLKKQFLEEGREMPFDEEELKSQAMEYINQLRIQKEEEEKGEQFGVRNAMM